MQQKNTTTASQATQSDESGSEEQLESIRPEEITVAIFCALPEESVAVKYTLDQEFQCRLESGPPKYVYSFGQIKEHKVVIARPPQIGKVNAAQLAAAISLQFSNLRFALMIGIGAGIPDKRDIRLGDIAVSIPRDNHPGVLEYDFGKAGKDGIILKGSLNKPPTILLSADGQLEEDERMNKRPFQRILKRITKQPEYERPNATTDVLFNPTFHHVNEGGDCSGCEASNERMVIDRVSRESNNPVVHRGLILSGSLVVKNPEDRVLLRRDQKDAICYEMEAAGIMDEIPCLVVRGISDYADTHKQDEWKHYAAAAAAAYGRAILCKIYGRDLEGTSTIRETMGQIYTKVDALGESVYGLRRELNNTTEAVQGVANSQQKAERNRILKWLDPGTASSRHDEVKRARLPGTSKWFLVQTAFSRWSTPSDAEEKSRILWCYGIPGAGKSTISSVVIDHLKETRDRDATMQTAVIYFYFDYSNKVIDTHRFTRSLLKQLASQSPKLPQELVELTRKYSESRNSDMEDQKAQDLLVQCVSNFLITYVVVDALDECDPNQRLDVIWILQKLANAGARIFVTSRPHPEDINEIFKKADKIELSAKPDDIRKVIRAEILKSQVGKPKEKHVSDDLKGRIIEGLTQGSNGMFLLPKLQVKFLLQQATLHRMEIALSKILEMLTSNDFHPIDETFNLMYESIKHNKDLAYKALSWLVASKLPLRMDDLLTALAIEPGNLKIPKNDQLLPSTVLDICVGFVIVDEKSGIARLTHQTVQEYLLRKRINAADALASLTRTCLNYLCFEKFAAPGFWDSLEDEASVQLEKKKQIPFYLYAVQNWEAQLVECSEESTESDLIDFLNRRSSVLSYCQARRLIVRFELPDPRYWYYCVGIDESPLRIASRVGHLGAMRYFISQGIDIDINHDGELRPIWEAVAFGRIEAVKLLVENGSSPHAAWREGKRPMHLAAALGHTTIVKYLLGVGCEVDVKNEAGYSALQEAGCRGHEETVHLLLDVGADWRLELNDKKNAAFSALEFGWPNIFSIFLKRGMNLKEPLSGKVSNSGTPLHIVALHGYQETVKEILELDATDKFISLTDSEGNTALHNAIIGPGASLPIVKLLVEHGIDINKRNKEEMTALKLANRYRFTQIEQYLQSITWKQSQDHQGIYTNSNAATILPDPNVPSESCPVAEGTSLSDIFTVYSILTRRLNIPALVAKQILEHASYWLEQHTSRSETVSVTEKSHPVPYLHLSIDAPFVRRIVFRTVSHDQDSWELKTVTNR
ncbi:hypothetical protein TWF173_000436 [Orbilia oligospora]|nr:hypothetical protein TWF173_000436 [Orbilia oligospora]